MAAAKRFTTEQIVAKLREAEKLQAQGMSIPVVCKQGFFAVVGRAALASGNLNCIFDIIALGMTVIGIPKGIASVAKVPVEHFVLQALDALSGGVRNSLDFLSMARTFGSALEKAFKNRR